uniref:Uncharacterized protein n=1 Tax=Anguilla anguilla TaxID=7936 RepID=A0A0E9X029_ANGAN
MRREKIYLLAVLQSSRSTSPQTTIVFFQVFVAKEYDNIIAFPKLLKMHNQTFGALPNLHNLFAKIPSQVLNTVMALKFKMIANKKPIHCFSNTQKYFYYQTTLFRACIRNDSDRSHVFSPKQTRLYGVHWCV